MADVTTVLIGPDVTGLVVEDNVTHIVAQDEETVITSTEIHTVVVYQENTVVVGAAEAGPQGPPGTLTDTLVIAGQTLSAGKLVTLTASGALYFNASDIALYGKAVGITKHAANIGTQVAIQLNGPVDLVGAGYTAGQRFWAGASGNLLTAPPTSGLVIPVGYAVDSNTLMVQIESYLEW